MQMKTYFLRTFICVRHAYKLPSFNPFSRPPGGSAFSLKASILSTYSMSSPVYAAASDMESRRSVRDASPSTNIFWNCDLVSTMPHLRQKMKPTPSVEFDTSCSRSRSVSIMLCCVLGRFCRRTCAGSTKSPLEVMVTNKKRPRLKHISNHAQGCRFRCAGISIVATKVCDAHNRNCKIRLW